MTGSSKVALEYGQINTRAEGHSEWHVRVSTGSVTGAFQTVLHSAFIGIYPKGTRCGYSEHASVILQPLPQHAGDYSPQCCVHLLVVPVFLGGCMSSFFY